MLDDPRAAAASVIAVESLGDWCGQPVVDPDGEKLGTLDEVFYDSETDTPAFVAVKSGVIGKHLTLVPLAGASAGRAYVRVAHSKAQVKDAPNHDTDTELSLADETAIYGHYGIAHTPVGDGARRLAKR